MNTEKTKYNLKTLGRKATKVNVFMEYDWFKTKRYLPNNIDGIHNAADLFAIVLWHETVGHGREAIQDRYTSHNIFKLLGKKDRILEIENEARKAWNCNVPNNKAIKLRKTTGYSNQRAIKK